MSSLDGEKIPAQVHSVESGVTPWSTHWAPKYTLYTSTGPLQKSLINHAGISQEMSIFLVLNVRRNLKLSDLLATFTSSPIEDVERGRRRSFQRPILTRSFSKRWLITPQRMEDVSMGKCANVLQEPCSLIFQRNKSTELKRHIMPMGALDNLF